MRLVKEKTASGSRITKAKAPSPISSSCGKFSFFHKNHYIINITNNTLVMPTDTSPPPPSLTSSPNNTLTSLPYELLLYISTNVTRPNDVLALCMTCKYVYQLLSKDGHLWYSLFQRKWNGFPFPARSAIEKFGWYTLYSKIVCRSIYLSLGSPLLHHQR